MLYLHSVLLCVVKPFFYKNVIIESIRVLRKYTFSVSLRLEFSWATPLLRPLNMPQISIPPSGASLTLKTGVILCLLGSQMGMGSATPCVWETGHSATYDLSSLTKESGAIGNSSCVATYPHGPSSHLLKSNPSIESECFCSAPSNSCCHCPLPSLFLHASQSLKSTIGLVLFRISLL